MNTINNMDKNTTLIIIAHRKSTLEACDYVIEISDGKIKVNK